MIKIYIRNKWNGMVAIRDKYIKDAKETKEDLELRCEFEVMTIPFEEIEKRIKFRKGPIEDKFSKEKHMLVYFWWTKDKVNGDPEKKKLSLKAKKAQETSKKWEEANRLMATDPQAFQKKFL